MTEKEKKVNVNSAEAMENVYLTSLLYMFKISILSLIKKKLKYKSQILTHWSFITQIPISETEGYSTTSKF